MIIIKSTNKINIIIIKYIIKLDPFFVSSSLLSKIQLLLSNIVPSGHSSTQIFSGNNIFFYNLFQMSNNYLYPDSL